MANNSVSFHRVFKASPEKLFRAFTQANAIAAWLPPYGFLCTVHDMQVEEGGTYRMSFENFTTGSSSAFFGEYKKIVPNEYLEYTDQFEDPSLPGIMTTTIEFKKVSVGTEIRIHQTGLPAQIPADGCYLGWQDSLDKLYRLVEPEIPDM